MSVRKHPEPSHTIRNANKLTGFYMIEPSLEGIPKETLIMIN